MKRLRAVLGLAAALPLAGCVFAVGTDSEGDELLRDRVRELEHRVERLERGPHGTILLKGGEGGMFLRHGGPDRLEVEVEEEFSLPVEEAPEEGK